MANRSYLYASDLIPARDDDPSQRRLIGISEWNYDIPAAYKLLASGAPRTCISNIWKLDQKITIASDYDHGVQRLLTFLDHSPQQLVASLREEARQFLTSPENRRKFFIVECAEIFALHGDDLAAQNQRLVEEIQDFKPVMPRSEGEIETFGLGNWSNVLYFDPNPS